MAEVSKISVKIGADTKDLEKGLNHAKQETSKFGEQIKKIGGLVAGAFAVSKVIDFAKECIKLAEEAEGVKTAFDRLNEPGLLSELRTATKGTVNDLDLMKAAVQANNFNIPLKTLGSLLEFAHQRAKDTGQSVDY